jgi:RHS repeat-associated protein
MFYHTDPAGTPAAMTDPAGSAVWRADYLPFGEENLTSGTLENDFRFVGKENDKETGLYYFGARYMEAMIGRFVSPDPVGAVDSRAGKPNDKTLRNPQRINLYAYGLNNPYRYIDPDGNTVWDIADFVFFGYDVYKFAKEPSWANAGDLALDAVGLLPLIPSVGIIKAAGKALGKADDIVDIAKGTRWGRAETLADHFRRHGADFGATSPKEYGKMASEFFEKAKKENLPTKIAPDGTIRVYDPKSNTFGSYNKDHTTRTFFKPKEGQKYWDRQ